MANRIQIRHGSTQPTTSNLLPYELGWDTTNSILYIGRENNNPLAIGGSRIIPVSEGGTGRTTLTANYILAGNGTSEIKMLQKVPVAQGGTDRTTLTSNAILAGNGTSAINMITTANGALYATTANGAALFGTLPVAQGGTGQTSIANIQAGKDADGNTISSTYLKLSVGGNVNALTVGNKALILDSSTTERKLFLTTTNAVPSGAVAGDIVLVKVS